MERPTSSTKRVTTAITERLPPDHLAWLKEFSVAMHRRYAYPPKHPSRVAADDVAFTAVGKALEKYPEISMTIARQQIAIGGGYSDPKNPALCELAERFHRQGIGAITVRAGMSPLEFDALLTRIVESKAAGDDLDDEDDDIGPDDFSERPLGRHVAVEMLKYEGLALSDEGVDEEGEGADVTSDRLWRELAQVALMGWDGEDGSGHGGGSSAAEESILAATGGSAPDGKDAVPATAGARGEGSAPPRPSAQQAAVESAASVAKVINERAGDKRFASSVLKSLIRVGRHSRRRGRAGSGAVAARLRDVMKQLEPGTLRALLESESDAEKRRILFMQGVDALPVSVVLDWIEAAASSSGHSLSPYLLRLMKKLAGQARRRRDAGPDDGGEALRQAAKQLIEGWSFNAQESETHSALLEHIAGYEKGGKPFDVAASAGADRVVQMSLETDAFGPDVGAALDYLIEHRRLGIILEFLEGAPPSKVSAPAIFDHLEMPETLRRVLLTEPIDTNGTRMLLQRCGPARLDPLLDALALSESQSTRQMILDRLREVGEDAREAIVARLDASEWYVLRNLLSLLVAMPTPPTGDGLDAYARHEEPGVRVEAVRLLSRMPASREEVIHAALSDPDLQVVRAAVEAAAAGLPRRSALRVLQVAQKAESGTDLRLRSLALLENVPLPAARDFVLPLVTTTRGMFFWRRQVLQQRSPEMLAALRVLSSAWRKDPAAAAALKLAAHSGDEQIREAAGAAVGR